jgi:uncharacterized protein YecE (DUF72 family)
VLTIGTSGWQYRDWRGPFYPPGLPQRLWLEEYVKHFDVVEVNNAFYRLPERATFQQWRERTPAGFRFAVKMSRYLTHIRRLKDPAEPVARFLDRAAGLGDKLGPVLLQLPPRTRPWNNSLPMYASWSNPGTTPGSPRNAASCWNGTGRR